MALDQAYLYPQTHGRLSGMLNGFPRLAISWVVIGAHLLRSSAPIAINQQTTEPIEAYRTAYDSRARHAQLSSYLSSPIPP